MEDKGYREALLVAEEKFLRLENLVNQCKKAGVEFFKDKNHFYITVPYLDNQIKVKKEDNKIYIRLDQSKLEDLIEILIGRNDLKYVNLAFHIDREKAKEKIEDDIIYELRRGNIKFYIDNYEIFQKYGVDVKKEFLVYFL